MLLDDLRRLNPGLSLSGVEESGFGPYGEVVRGDWSGLVDALERFVPIPDDGVIYVPSHPPLERTADAALIASLFMGGMPVQTGFCAGRNSTLNGLEYHKCSEIIVAADDLVLLLGLRAELRHGPEGPSWDSSSAAAFLLGRGMAIELYTGTLHLAPCRARAQGFRAAIILARETNMDYPAGTRPEGDPLLRKTNKWIIAHPERDVLVKQGVLPGIRGPNIAVIPAGGET